MCVCVNTIVLAMDQYPMNSEMETNLNVINEILTYYFIIEMVLKMYVLGRRRYFKDDFNCFDFLIVVVSIVEIVYEQMGKF